MTTLNDSTIGSWSIDWKKEKKERKKIEQTNEKRKKKIVELEAGDD